MFVDTFDPTTSHPISKDISPPISKDILGTSGLPEGAHIVSGESLNSTAGAGTSTTGFIFSSSKRASNHSSCFVSGFCGFVAVDPSSHFPLESHH